MNYWYFYFWLWRREVSFPYHHMWLGLEWKRKIEAEFPSNHILKMQILSRPSNVFVTVYFVFVYAGYATWTSSCKYNKSYVLPFMTVDCSWRLVKKQKTCARLLHFFTLIDHLGLVLFFWIVHLFFEIFRQAIFRYLEYQKYWYS